MGIFWQPIVPRVASRRRGRRLALTSILWPAFFAAQIVFASSTHLPFWLPDLAARKWTVSDGLPTNAVTTLLFSREGFLWVGTEAGLVCFDGLHFTPIHGFREKILALCESSTGKLWIGTADGLFAYSHNTVQRVNPGGGKRAQTITSITEDGEHDLWVGTISGLEHLHDSNWTFLTTRDGLPDDFVSGVYASPAGPIWIATRQGVIRYQNGKLDSSEMNRKNPGIARSWGGLMESSPSNIWAFGGDCLFNLSDQDISNTFRAAAPPSLQITSICAAQDGALWVGTEQAGLLYFEAGKFETCGLSEGELPNDVRAICGDDAGDLWLGTGEGLVRLRHQNAQLLSGVTGSATCLAVGNAGQLWAVFQDQELYLTTTTREESDWTRVSEVGNLITTVYAASDNSLWLGTLGAGLYCVNDGQQAHFTTADGLPDDAILALTTDDHNALWIGTRSGNLVRFSAARFQAFGTNDGLPGAPVTAIVPSPDDGMWVGTASGRIFHEQRGKFIEVESAVALRGSPIQALSLDADGRLWVGSLGAGLACLVHHRCVRWSTGNGLPDNRVWSVSQGDNGRLWMGTSKGIFYTTETNADSLVSGRSEFRVKSAFRGKDLVSWNECPGYPRCQRDSHGILWFATPDGIVRCKTANIKASSTKIPTYIESILINGQSAHPTFLGPLLDLTSNAGQVCLPTHLQSIAIQFTAPCFTEPEKIHFFHKLDGYDADWLQGVDHLVRYGKLPSGSYRFSVKADCDDVGAGPEATFAFLIPIPLWRTWWAITIYTCLAIVLAGGTGRWFSHQRVWLKLRHLEEQNLLEKERIRIAQDMHDQIGSRLTKISFLSERAKEGLDDKRVVAEQLKSIANSSRELLRSMDEIVWAVDPNNDSLEHLVDYLGQYTTEYFQNTTVACHVRLPRLLASRMLTAEARHDIFLAFQEALNNALKHGHPSHMLVDMKVGQNQFEISVQDDGCGFDPSQSTHRNGLANMRQRMMHAQGECTIRTRVGEGTSVTLVIPLANSKEVES